MSQVGDVRDGLVVRLNTIDGLNAVKWIGQNIQTPMAVVGWPEVDYDQTMQRGRDRWIIPVWVIVGQADNKSAVEKLESYMDGSGATSVKTAIQGDRTLGGKCETLSVDSFAQAFEWSPTSVANAAYLAAEWSVRVVVKGS